MRHAHTTNPHNKQFHPIGLQCSDGSTLSFLFIAFCTWSASVTWLISRGLHFLCYELKISQKRVLENANRIDTKFNAWNLHSFEILRWVQTFEEQIFTPRTNPELRKLLHHFIFENSRNTFPANPQRVPKIK
jgi:hypothetical protein